MNKTNSYLLLSILAFCSISCCTQKTSQIVEHKANETAKQTVTAPIVYKSFIKKNGEPTDTKEVYIRMSIQDYFVKFCDSKVTRQQLEDYLSEVEGEIKTATLEIEIRNGSWDICDENYQQQSRIGDYAIIHRIISK